MFVVAGEGKFKGNWVLFMASYPPPTSSNGGVFVHLTHTTLEHFVRGRW